MQNTKELLLAFALVGKLLVDRLKDGVQLDDALAIGAALANDEKLKAAVKAAMKDVNLVDDELKDIDLLKALDLLKVVPEIMEALELQKK